ncbi:MAG: carbohydrate kinase family protein [Treponema sp.]|jgi:ribokinase|nr:carbohydrate kinase family protein [Treponema sp.]
MNNILVSGHINIEITVKIDDFPIAYTPVDYDFFGVNSTIAGVGYNISSAIKILGGNPTIFSIIGNDIYKNVIFDELKNKGINTQYVLPLVKATSQSIILYNENKRKIILDLKDIQETKYPIEKIDEVINKIDVAILCNINYSRGLLKIVKEHGKLIASDVHVINDINDAYNKDFMEYADILFLSNEKILGEEQDFIKQLKRKYKNIIIVIGMGENGLLIYSRENNEIKRYSAVRTRKIVNTIGAGDALFSSFIYLYNKTKDIYYSIEKAQIFASYKIGEKGAAEGFLTEDELLKIRVII